VGAADLAERPEPYSAPGPPAGLELYVTPRLLTYDTLGLGVQGQGSAFGTSLAAPFAAGAAAALLSGGWSREAVVRGLQERGPQLLVVPAGR
jgi:hypothetical protein